MSLTQRLRAHTTRGQEPRRRLQIKEIGDPAAAIEADTIGGALRAARLGYGLEIGNVARELRIKRQHIEALEENDFAHLPPTAYALGFVRTYATYLRLDPDECLRRFKVELKASEGQHDHQAFQFPEVRGESWLPQGSVLIFLALLGIGAYAGWYVSVTNDRATAERVPPVPERLAESSGDVVDTRTLPYAEDAAGAASLADDGLALTGPDSDPEAVGGPSMQVELDRPSAPPDEAATGTDGDTYALVEDGADMDLGVLLPSSPEVIGGDMPEADEAPTGRIVLRARERTWVRVEDANSQILIQQELDSGEGYLVPNRPGLILSVRDAGALDVFIDGEPLGRLGRPGEALPALSLDPATLKADRPS